VVAAHYKKDDLLNCWTSSSVIFGYHADFHEGHGTVGAGQGKGMGTAWVRHAVCESAFTLLVNRVVDDQISLGTQFREALLETSMLKAPIRHTGWPGFFV